MFFTAKMRYLQIVILEKDFQKTLDLLSRFGWIEIKQNPVEKKERFDALNKKIRGIEEKIIEITNFFNIEKTEQKGELRDISEIEEYFTTLEKIIREKKDKTIELSEQLKNSENGLKELELFRDLKITKKELEDLNFFFFKIGSMTKSDMEKLTGSSGTRVLTIELSKDLYIIFSSKKGRWTLESELKKLGFKERNIPLENDLLPSSVYGKINDEVKSIKKELEDIEKYKKKLLEKEISSLVKMIESFNLQKIYNDVYQSINHSDSTTIIEGWVLQNSQEDIKKALRNELNNRLTLLSYAPEEVEDVKNKKIKVPAFMENKWIFKPFEELIFNYGAPVYGSVDPTTVFALTFLLMFGFMFGDIGQGFVIFLAGIFLSKTKSPGLVKYKKIAPIMSAAGVSAMIFGYLFGSIFCFEHVEKIFTPINKALFNINTPFIINSNISFGITVVFNLVFFTIGLGLTMNLFGIFINILNNFFQNKKEDAFFSRNGIAGFALLFSVFIIFLNAISIKAHINKIMLIIILSSTILILIKEPLYAVLTNKRPLFHHGVGFWILHSIVELIEIVLITMSNNLSFIRVGAFAVTHALLSYIIVEIASKIGTFGFIILVAGNAIIIGLEGLIVGIQTLRLEYYEFFSKFFIDKGERFIPFKIEKNRKI